MLDAGAQRATQVLTKHRASLDAVRLSIPWLPLPSCLASNSTLPLLSANPPLSPLLPCLLLQLADALIRYETLTGEEVQDLIKGKLVKKDYDALSGPSI
jgi:hypothetical protein